MALPKFTLSYDHKRGTWNLKNDKTGRTVKRFLMKETAIKGGILKRAVGRGGGSVRIEYKNKSGYEEERTFSPLSDPRKSKG